MPEGGVTYRARLGDEDHHNKEGVQLQRASQIIRWDRANYHTKRHRDAEDTSDPIFMRVNTRNDLATLVEKFVPDSDKQIIVDHQPIVEITEWPDRLSLKVIEYGPPQNR